MYLSKQQLRKKIKTAVTEKDTVIKALSEKINLLETFELSVFGLWATKSPDKLTAREKEKCELFQITGIPIPEQDESEEESEGAEELEDEEI